MDKLNGQLEEVLLQLTPYLRFCLCQGTVRFVKDFLGHCCFFLTLCLGCQD